MVVKTVVEAQDIFDKAWEGFKGVDWKEKASISRFVQANYTPYDGDESFLAGPTERSLHIKKIVEETKAHYEDCLLYTSPSPRDMRRSRMPSSA